MIVIFSKNILAERLKNLRAAKNLSQEVIADIVGLKKQSISMIETSQRAASIEVLCALADYFDVSIDYLVGRSDEPKINK